MCYIIANPLIYIVDHVIHIFKAYDILPSLGDMQRKYLDVIDKFRQFGVEDSILIPEIVVLGEQSVGKSSVLEEYFTDRFTQRSR